MLTCAGFAAVAGYFAGFAVSRLIAKWGTKTVSDVYCAPERRQTPVQLQNACIIKLANEIRKTGAMRIDEIEPGKHKATLRVVK